MHCIPYILYFLLIVSCLIGVHSQQCNNSYPYVYNQTTTLKSGATTRLRIGMIGGISDDDRTLAGVICYQLNNDPNILPDVAIDLFTSKSASTSDVLLGTLFHINTLNINGLIAGFTSTDARTAQLAAKIYNVPHTSSLANSYTLSNKEEYPYFLRTYPSDSVQISSIIAIFNKFNWKKAIIVFTLDDYGSANSRVVNAGAPYNISFLTVGTTLTTAPDAVATIEQALNVQDYRIIIYYTQEAPGMAVMTSLYEKGYHGGDYVSIITTGMGGVYDDVNPVLEGVLFVSSTPPGGAVLDDVYNKWATSTTNPFPVRPKAAIYVSWFVVDAIMNYALTYDKLLKNGTAFSNIKGNTLYKGLIGNKFQGTTGLVAFDDKGDRLMNYMVFSLSGNATQWEAGYYNPASDDFVITGGVKWAGGRTTTPRDSPYRCEQCSKHGTCVENVGCVCHEGYQGIGCYEKKENRSGLIGGVVAAAAVAVIVIVGGFFLYRKKRSELVREVADKQRSKISRADISLQNRIGRGASGEVFKGSFRGTEVAVKKIITSNTDSSVLQEFELEVAIMCGLRHPNIILFMGSCYDADSKEMLLVMEFMTRGSLHDVLHNPQIVLNYDMKLHLACQAAQGMNFLHQSSPPIVHHDLKSHNILLDDKWNARISDFGITKIKDTKDKKNDKADKAIGTIYWSSPETLEGLETTEKSDCYSFGIVLWEIFHRKNPYGGRDPLAVALEVINQNMRPPIGYDVPTEIADLMQNCWDKDPAKRCSFQEIVTVLRELSMKNPAYNMASGTNSRMVAPSGKIYLVNTGVQDAFALWESCPKDMVDAMARHNNVIRHNLEMYRGYESKCNQFHSFMAAFHSLEDALNFCIATQVSLLHVDWPTAILKLPACREVSTSNGVLLWKGLRVNMSIYSGVPNCENDPSSDRMVYMGPVVERAQRLLKKLRRGYIAVTDTIVDEINKGNFKLVQDISTQRSGDMYDTARNENLAVHVVSIKSLLGRNETTLIEDYDQNHPHVLVEMEELQPVNDHSRTSSGNLSDTKTDWIFSQADVDVKEPIGKGSMGDYSRAMLKGTEVAVKTLINQRLKEEDMLKLVSDSALMYKINHPNLLKFYAVCLDEDHLSVASEYMAKGSLKTLLADSSVTLSLNQKIKIALDIANGMSFLNSHSDPDIRMHNNLKSNNILVGKTWEVKVADYGHSNLKELARTMTSVGSVAWTAPELLSGDAQATPSIAVYSFGIILWELYTRQIPYSNEHPIRVVSKILSGYRPPIPTGCPPNLSQLISNCLESDPEARPSWNIIISSLSDLLRTL